MIQEIPLYGGLYEAESRLVSSQTCLNWYPNIPESQGISEAQLYPTPALEQIADTGDFNINRGAHLFNDEYYCINNNKLYRLNRVQGGATSFSYNLEELGEISGTGRVSLADNGFQLCIVIPDTGIGYIYEKTNGLQQITDPDFTAVGNADVVVFMDGYFVFSTQSKRFFISALNDGLSYNALDFGTAEADPDDIRGLHVHKNQLYVFGSQTCEVFRNVGGQGFPFQRITGFVLPKGLAAKFSIIEYSGAFAFVGQGENESARIYMYSGNDFQPISTTAIDLVVQKNTDIQIQDCFVWSYDKKGADFVGWTFANGTFVFESKASQLTGKKIWHERKSSNVNLTGGWRVNSLVAAYGLLICGDSDSGIIGQLDFDGNTEYGNNIVRELTLPTISSQSKRVYHGSFEVEIETGLATTSETPEIEMTYSDDAKAFVSYRTRSLGKIGEYSKKVKWQRLGNSNRFRIYRLRMTDTVRCVIYRALVDLESE